MMNDSSLQPNVRELSRLRPWTSYTALILDWTIIATCITVSEKFPHWLIYVAAIFIIAARQHALLIFMHEGAHQRLSSNSWMNDFISDFFAAFPILGDTRVYRRHHLEHHRNLNTERDPDWVRKIRQPVWQFPRAKALIYKDALKYIFLGIYDWTMIAKYFSNRRPTRIAYFLGLISLILASGSATIFFSYWVVPLFLIFPSIQRIRSISEHFGLERTNDLNSSRNVLAPSAELFFFGPHNVNYHLDHHLFPSVPFYNLKKLNRLLNELPTYKEGAHQNTSYIWPTSHSVLQDLERPLRTNQQKDVA